MAFLYTINGFLATGPCPVQATNSSRQCQNMNIDTCNTTNREILKLSRNNSKDTKIISNILKTQIKIMILVVLKVPTPGLFFMVDKSKHTEHDSSIHGNDWKLSKTKFCMPQ